MDEQPQPVDDVLKNILSKIQQLDERVSEVKEKGTGNVNQPKESSVVVHLNPERPFRVFNGTNPDPVTWIEDVQRRIRNLPIDDQVQFLMDHLEGPAKDEVSLRPYKERSTATQVLQILNDAFHPANTISASVLMRGLYNRSQSRTESLRDYSHALLKLFNKAVKADPKLATDREEILKSIFELGVREELIRREIRKVRRDDNDITFIRLRDEVALLVGDDCSTKTTNKIEESTFKHQASSIKTAQQQTLECLLLAIEALVQRVTALECQMSVMTPQMFPGTRGPMMIPNMWHQYYQPAGQPSQNMAYQQQSHAQFVGQNYKYKCGVCKSNEHEHRKCIEQSTSQPESVIQRQSDTAKQNTNQQSQQGQVREIVEEPGCNSLKSESETVSYSQLNLDKKSYPRDPCIVADSPRIDIKLGNIEVQALLDTGSQVSIIRSHILRKIQGTQMTKTTPTACSLGLRGINGTSIPYEGYVEIDCEIFGQRIDKAALLVTNDGIKGEDTIIGMNILKYFKDSQDPEIPKTIRVTLSKSNDTVTDEFISRARTPRHITVLPAKSTQLVECTARRRISGKVFVTEVHNLPRDVRVISSVVKPENGRILVKVVNFSTKEKVLSPRTTVALIKAIDNDGEVLSRRVPEFR